MKVMLKLVSILICFGTANCFAIQTPTNALQVQYQKRLELQQKDNSSFTLNLSSVSQIPETTYRYLEEVFSSFSGKLTFNTSIIDSTFDENSYFQLISVPLVSPNNEGLQMELFGNLSDPSKQYLSNLSTDHALYDYIANTEQIDFQDSSLSLGAGISFNASETSKIKIVISNHKMPGYGDSQALLGFETRF